MSWQDQVTWVAVGIELVSLIYYIRSIVKGPTRPHPISWAGWTAIGAVGAWAARSGGAGLAFYVAAAFVVVTGSIFVVSLLPGYGHETDETSITDRPVLVLGVLLIGLRILNLGAPWIHASLAVAGDSCFTWFTIRKAMQHPDTEPLWPWLGAVVAASLGIVVLGAHNYTAMAFPVYLLAANVGIAGATVIGRVKKSKGHKHKG